MMEEELGQILGNEELDNDAKQQKINELIGKNFVGRDKYNEANSAKKTQLDAYNSLKKEFDTFKQSKMSDEEKQAELVKQQAEENKAMKIMLNEMTARSIFSEAGLEKEDYNDLIGSVVQEDAEKTKTLAEQFCNALVKQKEKVEKSVKDKIIHGQETPPSGNDNNNGSGSKLEQYEQALAEARKSNNMLGIVTNLRLIQEEKAKLKK